MVVDGLDEVREEEGFCGGATGAALGRGVGVAFGDVGTVSSGLDGFAKVATGVASTDLGEEGFTPGLAVVAKEGVMVDAAVGEERAA